MDKLNESCYRALIGAGMMLHFCIIFIPSHKGKDEFHFPSSHWTIEASLYPELQANLRRVPCSLLELEAKTRPFEGATGGGQWAWKDKDKQK